MTSGGGDHDPPSFQRGDVIAERYELDEALGRGAFGEVWSAQDRSAGRPVAIKLLFSDIEIDLSRWEEEVQSLRQGLPGVVALLDDGQDGSQRFVVMELICGKPFPGVEIPCDWASLHDTALSLLETLAWVHASFVVHRDLKPANVLVTADKQVRLLDFGVAYRHAPLANDTRDRLSMFGTPYYMAPEQIQRRPATDRSDLYAVGLMLYQALSGQIPHAENDKRLFFARLNRPVTPLREIAPHVPENVARVIDRLLAHDPADRFASAFEVADRLRGEGVEADPSFLWLGPRTGLLRVLEAVREGRSIDIAGPRGSGRTRWLQGILEPLSTTHEVLLVEAAKRGDTASEPLRDLLPIAAKLGLDAGGDIESLAAALTSSLTSSLAAGHALLVDDHEDIDDRSRAVIDAVRAAGRVVRARRLPLSTKGEAHVVHIEKLTEVDLQPLFAGPDRLFHLREDAARVLHRRTEGSPSRVFREIGAWIRLGLVRRTRNLLVIQRSTIEQLDSGVLAEVMLANPRADTSAEGAAKQPISEASASARDAHLSMAKTLTPGHKGRLSHLWRAGHGRDSSAREIAKEALVLAGALYSEARIGAAIGAIEVGLHAIRWMRSGSTPEGEGLFLLWAEAALDDGSPGVLGRLSYAVHRSPSWPGRAVIEALARTSRVDVFGSPRALDAAQEIPAQSDPRLERLRIRALLRALRLRLDDAAEETHLHELMATSGQDPQIAFWIRSSLRRLRYRQGRFLEAAEPHPDDARVARPLDRIAEKNAAAWALFEAFQLDRAHAIATAAHALAVEHRHAGHEAAAAWTLRSIAYRRGSSGAPDMDLARAVMYGVDRQLQGVIHLTEAAAAYRASHPDGLSLATRAHEILSAIDQPRGALLARCLSIALGAAPRPGEIEALQQKALTVGGAGIGLQALALLAQKGHLPPADMASRIADLAANVPRESWSSRIDVLSVEESLAALGASMS